MPQSFSRCGPGVRSIVGAVIGAPARARYSATESSAESAAAPRPALEAATRATTGNGARWMLVWFESLRTTGVIDVIPRRSATATAAWIALSRLASCITLNSSASNDLLGGPIESRRREPASARPDRAQAGAARRRRAAHRRERAAVRYSSAPVIG